MNDARLQELYQQSLAARGASGHGACPAPEAILALVERRGPEEERLAVLDHVMACEACRADFELLRAVVKTGESEGEATGAQSARSPRWRSVPLLAAAAVAVLLLGGTLLWWTVLAERSGPDVIRGAGAEVVLVAPAGEVPVGEPVTLVWRAVAGAVGYTAEVLDADGELIVSLPSSDTVVAVPATAALEPGVRYRWWVLARLADGSQRRSGFQDFRLQAP